MFSHESSPRPSSSEHERLSSLETLIRSGGEIRLVAKEDIDSDGDHRSFVVPGTRLGVVCDKRTDPATLSALREALRTLVSLEVQLAQTTDQLSSRDRTLSLIASATLARSEEITSTAEFVESLLAGAKYALLKDAQTLLNHGVSPLAIDAANKRLAELEEHGARILDGELYCYRSEPYRLFIESPCPIETPVKALIRLYLSQIGENERLLRRASLQRASESMEWLAMHDPLTDLLNRRGLEHRTADVLGVSDRSGQTDALLHLDLDYFKYVNDTLGHAAGDALLVRVARVLDRNTRSQDLVARMGGDEFSIICPDIETERDALSLAARLIEELGRPQVIDGVSCRIGASIGIAFQQAGSPLDRSRWLDNADLALYASKQAGRERYHVYEEGLRRAQASRLAEQQTEQPAEQQAEQQAERSIG